MQAFKPQPGDLGPGRLGRLAPEYRHISLGTRLLLGLGRPMIRKLYLGRGPRDEVQQGLQGST